MIIYQRCLSKSLIFFSMFFVVFLLFVESNMGFKWIFNFTNRFFIGLKAEEISGNWRDFTLKNINYDLLGFSIYANKIHVMLDVHSLFKISTIFKKIETNNMTISFKKNIYTDSKIKNIFTNFSENNFFIKNPIIFKKVHIEKILFKMPEVNIFFLNVSTGVELINNNVIISPTYIDAIHIKSSNIKNIKGKYITNKLNFMKSVNNTKKIYNFLCSFSNKQKIFFPFDLDLKFLKCKKISFLNYEKNNSFKLKLRAKIQNNILEIKKIQINSSLFKIKSYGKVFFNNKNLISLVMRNKLLVPKFHRRIINFLFKANLTDKFIFKLKSDDSSKINMYGKFLLNNLDYPFFIQLKSNNLLFPENKNFIFKFNNFNSVIRGTINNYFFSLKNILSIKGMPSIFINLNGRGNLENIFLRKIKFSPIKTKKIYKKIINFENYIKYNHDIELIGKINIEGKSINNKYNLCIPKIYLDSNIMKKKISILGSLYYKNFNFLEIPGINLIAGNNKLYFKGLLGKNFNVHSSIYIGNLDYFLPNSKGLIKAKVDFHGDYTPSNVNRNISLHYLNRNTTNSKTVQTLKYNNVKNTFSGKILVDAKKIRFANFYLNALHAKTNWNNNKQRFNLLLKNSQVYINLILNGIFDKKTGDWHGFFKKIRIKTFWGQINTKKNIFISYSSPNNNMSNFYRKNIKKENIFLSLFYKTQKYFFDMFNQSLVNFKSELSVNAKFNWILGEKISNGKIFLTGKDIVLEKKTPEKIFFENIDYLRLSISLVQNTFKSKWIAEKKTILLKNRNITGYLNILDIYNEKKIEGKFTILNFPISFINFFTTDFKQIKGVFKGNIKFFGNLYQPQVSADVNFQNVFIKSDNILKYITLFFPYFSGKIENIRINQEVIMKTGNILFTLDSYLKNSNDLQWNLLFSTKEIEVLIFPKIKIKCSSQLNLHYLLSKYDLVGYIKFPFFNFKINEKNFVF